MKKLTKDLTEEELTPEKRNDLNEQIDKMIENSKRGRPRKILISE